MDHEQVFLSVQDVAKLLGVSPERMYGLVSEGVVPAIRIGRRVRIPKHTFDAWIAQVSQQAIDSANRRCASVMAGTSSNAG